VVIADTISEEDINALSDGATTMPKTFPSSSRCIHNVDPDFTRMLLSPSRKDTESAVALLQQISKKRDSCTVEYDVSVVGSIAFSDTMLANFPVILEVNSIRAKAGIVLGASALISFFGRALAKYTKPEMVGAM